MAEEETIIKTWENIAQYSPFSVETLKKKYAHEMFASGAIFKSRLGKNRNVTVWGFPSQIKLFWTRKAEEDGLI